MERIFVGTDVAKSRLDGYANAERVVIRQGYR